MADSKPKREAKVVERLELGEVKAKEEFKVVAGKGTRLGDIENVEFRIGKALSSADEIKKLHRLCYGSEGQKTVVKKHLRDFSGFPEPQAEKKKEQILKMDGGLIKKIMMMCDIPTTGTKDDNAGKLAAWLDEPSASGKKSDVVKLGEKRKRSDNKKAKKEKAAGKKAKTSKGKADAASKIKKPLTAFFLYSNNKRDKVKQENPSATVGEIAKILGEKWKGISDERRANYQRQAAELKAEYDAKVAKAGGAAKPKATPKAKKAKEEAAEEAEEEEEEEEGGDDEEGGGEEGGDEEGGDEEGGDEEGGDEEGGDEEGGDEGGDEEEKEEEEEEGSPKKKAKSE